ncbi:MAG: DNA polymerase I, partial [Bacilli bacterium]|nr:DNA polymerase I [Bacilli bacterium]
MKRVIAIDGNSLLFKAYFATKFTNMMQTSNGISTNAVFGFINMINKIRKDFTYDYFIVAFDASSNNVRKQQYPEYKGTRLKTDQELVEQFPIVREYLNVAGIPNYEVEGYEADDIIGTIASLIDDDMQLNIITSDKDLLQLVNDNVTVLLSKRGVSDYLVITPLSMNLVWDIKPAQVIDLKAIMGDPSDNIPGIKGIGEKGALKLLADYHSLDNIYLNIDDIKGKTKEKLLDNKDVAYQSYYLATIINDIKLPFKITDLVINKYDLGLLKDFYHRYEFKSFLDKIDKNIIVEDDFAFQEVENLEKECLLENSFIDLVSINDYYHKDRILGLAIINEKGNYFIKTNDFINNKEIITFLKNTPKQGYDIKRNMLLGYWHGLNINNFKNDVLISSYLIDCNVSLEANALVDSNFYINTISNKDLKKLSDEEIINNKVKQAYYLNKLININEDKLKTLTLNDLYQIEVNLAFILADMEKQGILVDKDVLINLNDVFLTRANNLEKQ